MDSHSSLIYCLWARRGAYPRVEHLEGPLIGQAPALPTYIRLGWKGLPGTNLQIMDVKSFTKLDPGWRSGRYKIFLRP
jgi:hypothetical protein